MIHHIKRYKYLLEKNYRDFQKNYPEKVLSFVRLSSNFFFFLEEHFGTVKKKLTKDATAVFCRVQAL